MNEIEKIETTSKKVEQAILEMANLNDDGAVQGSQIINYNWKKKTALFFIGQMITLIGSMLVQYAIIWYITQIYKSGIMVMLSTLCGFLPQAVISLFAGVWADRHSKKALIIWADIGIAFATLGIAVFFIFGLRYIWLIFIVLILRSAGQGIQTPAVNAFIPDLVPKEKLLKVNGFMGSMQAVVSIIPIALGGILYAFADMYIIFLIDVLTAIIGVSLLFLVKVKKVEKPQTKVGYFTDLKSGIKFISSNKFLKVFFFFYAVCMFIIVPVSFLSPLQVTRSFDANSWRLPALELLFSLGMIAGGIIIGFWPGFKSRTKTIAVANFFFGSFTVLLGIIPFLPFMLELRFGLYIWVMLLLGCTIPFFNAPSITVLQETSEPKMLGRVFGIAQIVSALALPLGMLLFGPLSDVVAIEWLLLGTGVLIIIYGYFCLRNKVLRNYKDYAYKSEAAEAASVAKEENIT